MRKLGLSLDTLKVESFHTGGPVPSPDPWDTEAVADGNSRNLFGECSADCGGW